jgi:hypothetical protein
MWPLAAETMCNAAVRSTGREIVCDQCSAAGRHNLRHTSMWALRARLRSSHVVKYVVVLVHSKDRR